MIDDHEVSHLPFRSWCSFCVRGRGQSMGHFRIDKGDEQVPTVSIDYGFLGTKEPNKGLEPSRHGSDMVLRALKETGYRRLVLKSD